MLQVIYRNGRAIALGIGSSVGLLVHYGRNITGDPAPKVDILALPPTS